MCVRACPHVCMCTPVNNQVSVSGDHFLGIDDLDLGGKVSVLERKVFVSVSDTTLPMTANAFSMYYDIVV